jgi:cellulose synthase/poly-beta-1,6-N-acetylglucosamine synthase-like glycosyltransferase
MPAEQLVMWIVCAITGGSYFILLLVLCIRWLRSQEEPQQERDPLTPLSVIIPARNEGETITACLEALSRQRIPVALLDVIVVDDHSTDDTAERANTFADRLPLRVISLQDTQGKKAALHCGINAAKHELLVTTDADTVAGPDWLRTIALFYERTPARMIIAPVMYHTSGFFASLQALEIAGLALVTGASAAAGKPLLANGANLAYTRTAFHAAGGFENDPYVSGDDVLLLQRVLERFPGEVHFLKSREATVYTAAQPTAGAFFNQRKRWASKFRAFRIPALKYSAFLVFLVNLLVVVFAVPACLSAVFTGPFLLLVCLKIPIDFLLLSLAASFFRKGNLLPVFFAALPLYSFYVVITAAGASGGQFTWKGRPNSK